MPSTELSAASELVIVRVFDAPAGLVYSMWAEKDHMARWSCPHGFVITHCDGDFRVGGAWRTCMRRPDGRDLWLGGVYREIVPNKRLVFTHAWDDKDGKPGHETVVTVTFADEDGRTRMTFHQANFKSVDSRDGHKDGWTQCFEKLEKEMSL